MRCKKLFPPSSSCSRVPEAKRSPPGGRGQGAGGCVPGPGAGPASRPGGGSGRQRSTAVFFLPSTSKRSTHFWKFIFMTKFRLFPSRCTFLFLLRLASKAF